MKITDWVIYNAPKSEEREGVRQFAALVTRVYGPDEVSLTVFPASHRGFFKERVSRDTSATDPEAASFTAPSEPVVPKTKTEEPASDGKAQSRKTQRAA